MASEEVTLTLPKIGCQGCVKKVTTVLHALPTMEVVQTDVVTKTVAVRYDGQQVSFTQIEAALERIGHVIAR